MHRKLIKEILHGEHRDAKECLEDLMIDMIDDLKHTDYDEYLRIEHKLYKSVYGEHLNAELAHHWVEQMQNKDGTHGEHWTMEQTNQYAEHYDKADWYAVMNMMYSDYYNPRFDTDIYIALAKDWLDDADVGPGKTLHYYLYVVCKK